jgi:hypothetical protein
MTNNKTLQLIARAIQRDKLDWPEIEDDITLCDTVSRRYSYELTVAEVGRLRDMLDAEPDTRKPINQAVDQNVVYDPGDAGFADRIDPHRFNFSPKLVAIVGAIIGHDYGVKDGRGGTLTSLSITSDGYVNCGSTASDGGGAFIGSADDLERNLAAWKAELTDEDRTEFDRIWKARVTDYRTGPGGEFRNLPQVH